MCLRGGSVWLRWREAVKVSFWSFCRFFYLSLRLHLTLVFPFQGHKSMKHTFNLERRGGLGLAWMRCFGFVLSFFCKHLLFPLGAQLTSSRVCARGG